MYISAQSIAAVAMFGLGVLPASAVPSEEHPIAERSLFGSWFNTPQNLCDKPNYGAVGKPWDHSSKPGAWCGGQKPSNQGQWAELPVWDGGDSVKCKSIFSRFGLNICFGGNKFTNLPWGCKPPKSGNQPVCELNYQVQYQDYKIVAPNGHWQGQTVGSATQDPSYMTYTLATNVDDCLKACDGIEGCKFVNTYYDTNAEEEDVPKHAPGVLTCAMFSKCVGTEQNNNFGGQSNGNQIYNSNGYCKSGACGK